MINRPQPQATSRINIWQNRIVEDTLLKLSTFEPRKND